MHIRAIILAGGTSSRMGKNKLGLKLGEDTVIKHVINNVEKSKVDEIVIVYGKYDVDTKLTKIYNDKYELGMSTSIIAGLKEYNGDAIMILLGDMPFVTSDIIDKLYEGFKNTNKNIVAPRKDGKKGNPVIIGRKYFEQLLNNTGDKGARVVIKNNPEDIEWVETDNDGIFMDLDDEEKYKRALEMIK